MCSLIYINGTTQLAELEKTLHFPSREDVANEMRQYPTAEGFTIVKILLSYTPEGWRRLDWEADKVPHVHIKNFTCNHAQDMVNLSRSLLFPSAYGDSPSDGLF